MKYIIKEIDDETKIVKNILCETDSLDKAKQIVYCVTDNTSKELCIEEQCIEEQLKPEDKMVVNPLTDPPTYQIFDK